LILGVARTVPVTEHEWLDWVVRRHVVRSAARKGSEHRSYRKSRRRSVPVDPGALHGHVGDAIRMLVARAPDWLSRHGRVRTKRHRCGSDVRAHVEQSPHQADNVVAKPGRQAARRGVNGPARRFSDAPRDRTAPVTRSRRRFQRRPLVCLLLPLEHGAGRPVELQGVDLALLHLRLQLLERERLRPSCASTRGRAATVRRRGRRSDRAGRRST
jgi:hypothetical protein